MQPPFIHPNIRKASTLPAAFYRSPEWFDKARSAIWEKCWLYAADTSVIGKPGSVYPFTLQEGVLDEPLMFTRDGNDNAHCLSNVCTHRGKVLIETAGVRKLLSCGYHGRCFSLDGRFRSMPGFEGVEDFPAETDHLHPIPFEEWMGMFFVSLYPTFDFREWIQPVMDRIYWMPLDTLHFSAKDSQDYLVKAHWALYCDNYLEGLHIPYVHPALNQALYMEDYSYALFPYGSLQLGISKEGEPCFDIPPNTPDFGKRIYAYYFFLFPNLMLNFYPWGLSVNIVTPLAPDRTLVRFRTYEFDSASTERAVNQIDQTELEDEAVVESVQVGLRSRFYEKGRYAPEMEQCVHHFHRQIAQFLSV